MKNRKIIRKKLIEWGENNTDNFPWRKPENLYELIVAEIMLIRTPPEQVLPVYRAFLKKYPNENKLSRENIEMIEDSIKKLGLAWRAERLKKMALFISEHELSNEINIKELKKIPGVGDYTAAAILIYFFKKRAVPVDSNTVRFFERVYNKEFQGEARRSKDLKQMMDKLIPEEVEKSLKFNEAFLDFMRKICKPENKCCKKCILADICMHVK